jgi:hypothetical protein
VCIGEILEFSNKGNDQIPVRFHDNDIREEGRKEKEERSNR